QNKALFRTSTHAVAYNMDTHAIETAVPLQGTANSDIEQNTMRAAYTRGNNLFVFAEGKEVQVTNEPNGILCGQSVHRDEFGINKGTFWSPNGNLLAFYWMDQRMVTDYPQVDVSTRIATMVPDKYPMAGTTSHQVKVGVYNPETQQTLFLKTANPENRYFTNVSWSPNEKSIFVIELNRDQNHAELIQYDATTGEKMAVLYEETHPKYVQPQRPLTFLPWDENKFIYQTERSGYNHLYLFDTTQQQEGQWQDCPAGGKCLEHVKVTPITSGDWLVRSILGFVPSTKEIVLQTTAVTPIDFTIQAVNVLNGKQRNLGVQEGSHRSTLSESGKWMIDNYSSATIAHNIDVLPVVGKGKTLNLLTAANPMDQLNLPEVSIGQIKAADGQTDLYYRLIKP
ncbi:MAG: DPP IV N-terminal domain-containing protein, partial [Bacteroidaceae bacterium]|nr:DPP IV N-terminal domain-containing protein [Bacteroidaceae bacterium]